MSLHVFTGAGMRNVGFYARNGFEAKPAGIRAMLPYVDDFRPVHNLASLAQIGDALRAVPRTRLPHTAPPRGRIRQGAVDTGDRGAAGAAGLR